ncbi:MAG TPA: thioredoxin domain-containing protein [Rhodanobacteraceae bacterium]|nr:thioredoxin domain-containing protein [Rhodanobacteraceae bacterium]
MNNRLANASSPYLRMHAGNPVEWQPWDDIALTRARDTDTPILLSIGYSACHWCHVMARECFEDTEIAAAMNRRFVNIKLDREERPDIDHVYQLAHQALSGRGGGWPLTAFLDPQNLSPFHIGTYFPPTPRHGLPGFPEVLQRVRTWFDTHRNDLHTQSAQLLDWLQHAEAVDSGTSLDTEASNSKALQRLTARFDYRWGGNQGAPKFPRAVELEWLLDLRNDRGAAHEMAHLTLATMAGRGLQDHLGGGFFRYCVDANWTIPHFEKMLYDNAELLPVYARVAAADGIDIGLRDTATTAVSGIVDWLARDMAAPNSTFYSSLDADSEHEEGKFYLWNREQMRAALTDATFPVAEHAFGLDRPPNFDGKAWHLLRVVPLDNVAWQIGRSLDDINASYAEARRRLLEVRARRRHPARDDKILTAWNALVISGLARTARLLDDTRCGDMAARALAALRESVWVDGELFANAAEPALRIPGFLDDHAFLLDALLETLQLAFDPRDLDWAIALAEALRKKFSDGAAGGFWFSTPGHATPLARSRTWTDDALPNGNGVAIRSLLRLGRLTGNTGILDSAERALHAAAGALDQYPDACPSMLRALDEYAKPRPQIVVRCPQAQRAAWRATVRDGVRAIGLAPGGDALDVFVIPSEAGPLPGLLAARESRGNAGTAWVCAGLTCQAPVTSPDELADAIRAAVSRWS